MCKRPIKKRKMQIPKDKLQDSYKHKIVKNKKREINRLYTLKYYQINNSQIRKFAIQAAFFWLESCRTACGKLDTQDSCISRGFVLT